MNNSKNCSIVILSYNTKDITDTAIEKAKIAAAHAIDSLKNNVEIIVVDNASTDGTVEMIKKKHNDVKLIALKENKWVSGGYNEGMKAAKYQYILLMNNDTYLFQDSILNSINWMEKNKQASVVIARLYDKDKNFVSYAGALPTPLKTILWVLGVESLPFIKNKLQRIYKTKDEKSFQKDMQIGWIPTCFLFMRREVFEKTGGEDENIPLYMEDLDFCKSINDLGFQIWYTPSIEAIHLGGKSTKDLMKLQSLLQKQYDGVLYYQKKHHPKTTALVKAFIILGLKMRAFTYFLLGQTEMAKAYNAIKFYEK